MLLGEAQSKCEHIAGVPLLPSVAQHLHEIFLAKGVLATTAIEGNTLTVEEVQKQIEGQLKLPPSKEYLGKEIDNIVEACNSIGIAILEGSATDLKPETIKQFNLMVLRNLPLDEKIIPGEIRSHSVVVGGYKAPPAKDCSHLLDKLTEWLNKEFEPPENDLKIAFGILKAIISHLYLAWIHPFGDGNGRTARLLEFQILLSVGVPSTSAHLLSNHYNQTRTEYYRQLDRASKTNGEVFPFIEYALQGFVDGLKEQVELIQTQQLRVHWINYIHDQFRDKTGATADRRRHLAIDLSNQVIPVSIAKVRHISPRIAEAYANKTDKTVRRDINSLEKLGILSVTDKEIRAKKEIMLGFLPAVRNDRES
ncbi:MAG: Fic family protein [Thermoleophilia bacterium]